MVAKDDEMFWPFATDGLYDTKSGYGFIRQQKVARTTSSSSGAQVPISFWKALWKVVWRVVRGILPVRKPLRVRGIDIEEVCPFCQVEDESIDHLMVRCMVVVRWWFVIMGGLRVNSFSTVQELLQQVFELNDPALAEKCVNFMWVIWEARNKLVFHGMQVVLDTLVARLQVVEAPHRMSPVP
ncbi:uncharacterized protein LOC130710343 [Lotus japonicus]|uniref:uncharacterized protein LOC130710343 n=1 Tax=Lotus japonicus TaxID=34305 RepID=UPI00258DC9D1|nr:uncharacterized protein LOC130710343 [Lotus japonicus]